MDPFTEEKAEAWRREVTSPRSHSLLLMKPAAMKWPCHCSQQFSPMGRYLMDDVSSQRPSPPSLIYCSEQPSRQAGWGLLNLLTLQVEDRGTRPCHPVRE